MANKEPQQMALSNQQQQQHLNNNNNNNTDKSKAQSPSITKHNASSFHVGGKNVTAYNRRKFSIARSTSSSSSAGSSASSSSLSPNSSEVDHIEAVNAIRRKAAAFKSDDHNASDSESSLTALSDEDSFEIKKKTAGAAALISRKPAGKKSGSSGKTLKLYGGKDIPRKTFDWTRENVFVESSDDEDEVEVQELIEDAMRDDQEDRKNDSGEDNVNDEDEEDDDEEDEDDEKTHLAELYSLMEKGKNIKPYDSGNSNDEEDENDDDDDDDDDSEDIYDSSDDSDVDFVKLQAQQKVRSAKALKRNSNDKEKEKEKEKTKKIENAVQKRRKSSVKFGRRKSEAPFPELNFTFDFGDLEEKKDSIDSRSKSKDGDEKIPVPEEEDVGVEIDYSPSTLNLEVGEFEFDFDANLLQFPKLEVAELSKSGRNGGDVEVDKNNENDDDDDDDDDEVYEIDDNELLATLQAENDVDEFLPNISSGSIIGQDQDNDVDHDKNVVRQNSLTSFGDDSTGEIGDDGDDDDEENDPFLKEEEKFLVNEFERNGFDEFESDDKKLGDTGRNGNDVDDDDDDDDDEDDEEEDDEEFTFDDGEYSTSKRVVNAFKGIGEDKNKPIVRYESSGSDHSDFDEDDYVDFVDFDVPLFDEETNHLRLRSKKNRKRKDKRAARKYRKLQETTNSDEDDESYLWNYFFSSDNDSLSESEQLKKKELKSKTKTDVNDLFNQIDNDLTFKLRKRFSRGGSVDGNGIGGVTSAINNTKLPFSHYRLEFDALFDGDDGDGTGENDEDNGYESSESTDVDESLPKSSVAASVGSKKATEVLSSKTADYRPPMLGSWVTIDSKPFGIIDGLSTRSLQPNKAHEPRFGLANSNNNTRTTTTNTTTGNINNINSSNNNNTLVTGSLPSSATPRAGHSSESALSLTGLAQSTNPLSPSLTTSIGSALAPTVSGGGSTFGTATVYLQSQPVHGTSSLRKSIVSAQQQQQNDQPLIQELQLQLQTLVADDLMLGLDDLLNVSDLDNHDENDAQIWRDFNNLKSRVPLGAFRNKSVLYNHHLHHLDHHHHHHHYLLLLLHQSKKRRKY
ncbi:hypothetical protein LELG_04140 [Lodderomyces elongisporus NRRL YB-4239]|uniref:Uncharacterized protein n=1 Tax=Lodderomyces elongisporus (strain ATCC 11503 / CBS 2605 / JCM 1781 / NBRC 1676 / NRRL YB-4239) TaxID=379508 RepID=A5E3F3_LODEL|nr:hypothetical protein LELG_04140 [Lodderomyces elongisporus NRRL YB-4239]